MAVALSGQADQRGGGFFAWWANELIGLMPASGRRLPTDRFVLAVFDGRGAGWLVYGPESAHYPTVSEGTPACGEHKQSDGVDREKICESALTEIACYDDKPANEHLEETGSYSRFDEPGSVSRARAALEAAKKN